MWAVPAAQNPASGLAGAVPQKRLVAYFCTLFVEMAAVDHKFCMVGLVHSPSYAPSHRYFGASLTSVAHCRSDAVAKVAISGGLLYVPLTVARDYLRLQDSFEGPPMDWFLDYILLRRTEGQDEFPLELLDL